MADVAERRQDNCSCELKDRMEGQDMRQSSTAEAVIIAQPADRESLEVFLLFRSGREAEENASPYWYQADG